MRNAVIRTVTSLRVLRTGATRLTALDRTFGQGTAAHGLGIGYLGRKLAHLWRGIGRTEMAMTQSYSYRCRKNKPKNWAFQKNRILLVCTREEIGRASCR